MRTPFLAGNWKMNKTAEQARALAYELSLQLREIQGVEKVLCPPFVSLLPVAAILDGSDVGLGAQNMHWQESGAFTGEIAPGMVAEFCKYVIIGHSERRTFFGETDESVNKKVVAAQAHELIPIICVGETLAEYESRRTFEVVDRQIRRGIVGLDAEFVTKIVIAYEPVWAIGTGRASSGESANAVVESVIRPALKDLFGEPVSQTVRVLYGGSVTGSNAAEFFGQVEIDGALVGGASLRIDEFITITRAAAQK